MTDEHIKRIMNVLKDTAGDINQYQRAQTIWVEVEKILEEEFLPLTNDLEQLTKHIEDVTDAIKNGIYRV